MRDEELFKSNEGIKLKAKLDRSSLANASQLQTILSLISSNFHSFFNQTVLSLFNLTIHTFVQKLNNAIHRINHYPQDSVVCFVNTHWIVIYPVDNVIQPLNNRDLGFTCAVTKSKYSTTA